MPQSKLPPKGSEEEKEYWERIRKGEVDQVMNELGYCERSPLYKAFRKRGYKLEEIWTPKGKKQEVEPQLKIITPSIIQYKPPKSGKGDPETQVVIIGDDHAGEITSTFNPEVYKLRFKKLFESVLTITNLHRNMYPLNDLVIIDVGDNVHGENPFQGAKVESVSCGAVSQVYDLSLPTILELLISFRQEFKTVKFYGVRGNHGNYSRVAPATSNWDLALYKALSGAKLPSGVEVNYSDTFQMMVNIENFPFFVFHGDQVKGAQYGIPYFALIRALKDWGVTYGHPPYAVCGHWHKEDFLRVTSEMKLLINGALVSDDPFALEIMKASTIPTHWTFGVHKHQGLTWLYSLTLDENFLPRGVK
jgi:hypothetical protein